MKRYILGAGAVVFVLTACGPDVASDSGDGALSAPDADSPSGEITIWDRSGDLYDVFDAAIDEFNHKYPDIVVHHEAVDIDAKLSNTLITGADVPDGVFLDDAKVAGFAEHLHDLSGVLEPYLDDIAGQKIDVNTVDGQIYGVPWDLNPGLLFYRADILDQLGIDPSSIETYDDLYDAAQQVKDANPDAAPIHLEQDAFLSQLWLEMFASQLGTSLADENGELRLDSPEYRQVLEWLDQVNKAGLGARGEYLGPADLATLENGEQVFVPWAIWWDFAPQQLLPETSGKWRAMPLPAWDEGGARSGAMGGSSFVIPNDAENAELAWLFYEFLVFDSVGYEAVYGPNDVYPGGLNTSVPSYAPAADPDRPLFEPLDALGGQDLWPVAIEAGNEIPGGTPIPRWWAGAVEYLGNNLQRMFDGDLTPDEVIRRSTEEIQTNLVDRQ
ncbi:ABC transporter substrate-binding protein [Phytoactinopolyspora halotolerans]|uniref:Extracellular solute-binding protein n=1 Tax=Phytoactinopolyspora halotolerans TaxID=1981512 RepID=A0A6L9SJB4_9ACTN|nr:extracellular solute-binding protein [Phytoactinopolyspora halotolerans]NEE04764.1 extracellular solute-binding protein [Phytoactinopolyspora halotolerans]